MRNQESRQTPPEALTSTPQREGVYALQESSSVHEVNIQKVMEMLQKVEAQIPILLSKAKTAKSSVNTLLDHLRS